LHRDCWQRESVRSGREARKREKRCLARAEPRPY